MYESFRSIYLPTIATFNGGGGIFFRLDNGVPLMQVSLRQIETKLSRYDAVQTLVVHHGRNLIEIVCIPGRDDSFFLHVGEQSAILRRSSDGNVAFRSDTPEYRAEYQSNAIPSRNAE